MKKAILVIFAGILLLTLCGGCGTNQATTESTTSPVVSEPTSEPTSIEPTIETSPSDLSSETPGSILMTLLGYWGAAESRFTDIEYTDGYFTYYEGVWQAGGGRAPGTVINIQDSPEQLLTLTVLFAAEPENELDGPYDEMTADIYIDYSGLDRDGKIRIKGYSSDEYGQYMYLGATSEEAYAAAGI